MQPARFFSSTPTMVLLRQWYCTICTTLAPPWCCTRCSVRAMYLYHAQCWSPPHHGTVSMVVYHLYHAGPTMMLYHVLCACHVCNATVSMVVKPTFTTDNTPIPPLCNGTRNCSMYWSHHCGKNPVEEIAQAVPYWCPTPLSHVRFVGQRL